MKMLSESALVKASEVFGMQFATPNPTYGQYAGMVIAVGEISAALHREENGHENQNDVAGYMAALRAILKNEPSDQVDGMLRLLFRSRLAFAYQIQQQFTVQAEEDRLAGCLAEIVSMLLAMTNATSEAMEHTKEPESSRIHIGRLADLASGLRGLLIGAMMLIPGENQE
jgi:hypothetical protein